MRKLVFLTGAGISAESGIPTFRGAIDGLWENHNVEEVATAKAIKEHPEVVYRFLNELRDKYKDCQPNSAHKAIAELEKDYDVPNYRRAIPFVKQADICVVIGTSFNVYPAAGLVQYVDINNPIYYIDPNPAYTPDYPDIKVIRATATEGMRQLLEVLKNG